MTRSTRRAAVPADPIAAAPRLAHPMTAFVLRSALGDTTNGGVSARVDSIIVIEDGMPVEDRSRARTFRIVRRPIFGSLYVHLEPVDPPPAGHAGWMAGGNYAHTSDGRFSGAFPYPLALHDRCESWQLYDSMRD